MVHLRVVFGVCRSYIHYLSAALSHLRNKLVVT
jgi:hypothetical protein